MSFCRPDHATWALVHCQGTRTAPAVRGLVQAARSEHLGNISIMWGACIPAHDLRRDFYFSAAGEDEELVTPRGCRTDIEAGFGTKSWTYFFKVWMQRCNLVRGLVAAMSKKTLWQLATVGQLHIVAALNIRGIGTSWGEGPRSPEKDTLLMLCACTTR